MPMSITTGLRGPQGIHCLCMNANLCFSQEIEVVRKFNGINVGIEYCILERRIK
jgi:hypothetical protein